MRLLNFKISVYVLTTLFLSGCGETPEVQMVKGGRLGACPDYTVSQIVDSFMGTPYWESGTSEEGQKFVNVNGNITYNEKEVNASIQFFLDEESSEFELNAFEMNDLPQMNLIAISLIKKMCDSAKSDKSLMTKKLKINLVNTKDKLNTSNLERDLLKAMELNQQTKKRVGDSGKAIQSYIQKSILSKKPHTRMDYTDYWVVKKPVSFMGHELVLIEEEYMVDYIGCCVSPGLGVTLKVERELSEISDFAHKNKCTLTKDINFKREMNDIGLSVNTSGKYISLSCRERDLQ